MSIDGLCLDATDIEANVERFGRPASSRGQGQGGAFPQVRVLGLAECGSHMIIDAAVGAYRQGEQTLAESVLRSLLPGMLLLADRGFFSYPLWAKAADTGAELLWRVKSNAALPVENRYSDGSFASHIYPGTKASRNDTNGIAVRVVEYTLTPADTVTVERTYRLITTITDPDAARPPTSPSSTPNGGRSKPPSTGGNPPTRTRVGAAVQNARRGDPGGLRLPMRALRRPLADALGSNRLRAWPRQAIVHPIRAARRTTARHPGFPPDILGDAATCVTDGILHQLLPARRPRANPRVVKRKMSGYQLKHSEHGNAPTINRRPVVTFQVSGIGANPSRVRRRCRTASDHRSDSRR